MKLSMHHIGYMVKNINKAIDNMLSLGYNVDLEPMFDEERDAEIAFLSMEGLKVELISPYKESNLYPLLKKYKNSPYHLCYMVSDGLIENAIEELQLAGYVYFKPLARAPVIEKLENCQNCLVAFMMSSAAGMIELLKISQ